MRVIIDIPKEFEEDLKDNFQDFFNRMIADITYSLNDEELMCCGNYERETAEMFLSAFNEMVVFDEKMKNKEVMCSLYPDEILEVSEDRETFDHLSKVSLLVPKQTVDWWNAPYKKEVEE